MKSFVVALASLLALGSLLAAVSSPARAQAGNDRVLVFVDDVIATDAKLKQEASALTSALCGALSKDKRLDVMCAPDVRQILGFAAATSMIGSTSPAVANVEKRLNDVKLVISASLAPRTSTGGATDVVLTVQAGPKSDGADASQLFAESVTVKVEEVTPAKQMKLLDRLPEVTAKLVKGMLAPAPPSASAPSPPPAPLK